jgi:hypothetical protein
MERLNKWSWLAITLVALAAVACGDGSLSAPEEAAEPDEAESMPEPTEAPEPELEEGATLHLVNQSGLPVCGLFMIASDSEDWGQNFLTNRPLAVGARFTISDVPPGLYDMKINDCDGNIVNWRLDIEVVSGAEGTALIEPPLTYLAVVNQSFLSVCGVYVALPDDPYRRNLLEPDQTIPAGIPDGPQELDIGLEPGPRNLKVESCEGKVLEPQVVIGDSGETRYDVFVWGSD